MKIVRDIVVIGAGLGILPSIVYFRLRRWFTGPG